MPFLSSNNNTIFFSVLFFCLDAPFNGGGHGAPLAAGGFAKATESGSVFAAASAQPPKDLGNEWATAPMQHQHNKPFMVQVNQEGGPLFGQNVASKESIFGRQTGVNPFATTTTNSVGAGKKQLA